MGKRVPDCLQPLLTTRYVAENQILAEQAQKEALEQRQKFEQFASTGFEIYSSIGKPATSEEAAMVKKMKR